MQRVYIGKTKDVYDQEDGTYLLRFKDDATGTGGVFDPGANAVGLSIAGLGRASLILSRYFFERIEAAGIPTHYIACSVGDAAMTVKPAVPFGKGVEVICRYRATGSFLRRYGAYAREGQPLDAFVEMTLKDDAREDPPITKDALEMLGIMTGVEYETVKGLTRRIADLIRGDIAAHGADMIDIKFEFGRVAGRDEIVLIDEISGGNMRVIRAGSPVAPLDLPALMGLV